MNNKNDISISTRGFTIVELLIVIVVIAILATISIVAYNGIQQRTRDSIRLQDAKRIIQALELYKADNNEYPDESSSGGWEDSKASPATFMSALQPYMGGESVPVDPINQGQYMYSYHRYHLSYLASIGCPTDRGELAVLVITDLEGEGRPASSSPGFSCGTRDWEVEGDWVRGAYER